MEINTHLQLQIYFDHSGRMSCDRKYILTGNIWDIPMYIVEGMFNDNRKITDKNNALSITTRILISQFQ